MARTFLQNEQRDLVDVMDEVKQITEQIEQADREQGTERPPGPALGRIYERLGVQLVAMARAGIPPFHAIRLIQQVAEGADDLNNALMISMFSAEVAKETDEPVWVAKLDDTAPS